MRLAWATALLSACGVGDERQPDPELRFDLGLRAAGLDTHEGQNAVAVLLRSPDGALAGAVKRGTVSAGGFAFLWKQALLPGAAYDVVFYLSAGDDCASAGDEVFRRHVPEVNADVLLEVEHDHGASDPTACAAFDFYDLIFTGSGYNQHNGQTMRLAVVRSVDDFVTSEPTETTIMNGAVFVQFRDVLQLGFRYEVHYYADHNDNGVCDAPPADHSWRVTAGEATGNAFVNHSAEGSYSQICDSFAR